MAWWTLTWEHSWILLTGFWWFWAAAWRSLRLLNVTYLLTYFSYRLLMVSGSGLPRRLNLTYRFSWFRHQLAEAGQLTYRLFVVSGSGSPRLLKRGRCFLVLRRRRLSRKLARPGITATVWRHSSAQSFSALLGTATPSSYSFTDWWLHNCVMFYALCFSWRHPLLGVSFVFKLNISRSSSSRTKYILV